MSKLCIVSFAPVARRHRIVPDFDRFGRLPTRHDFRILHTDVETLGPPDPAPGSRTGHGYQVTADELDNAATVIEEADRFDVRERFEQFGLGQQGREKRFLCSVTIKQGFEAFDDDCRPNFGGLFILGFLVVVYPVGGAFIDQVIGTRLVLLEQGAD